MIFPAVKIKVDLISTKRINIKTNSACGTREIKHASQIAFWVLKASVNWSAFHASTDISNVFNTSAVFISLFSISIISIHFNAYILKLKIRSGLRAWPYVAYSKRKIFCSSNYLHTQFAAFSTLGPISFRIHFQLNSSPALCGQLKTQMWHFLVNVFDATYQDATLWL